MSLMRVAPAAQQRALDVAFLGQRHGSIRMLTLFCNVPGEKGQSQSSEMAFYWSVVPSEGSNVEHLASRTGHKCINQSA